MHEKVYNNLISFHNLYICPFKSNILVCVHKCICIDFDWTNFSTLFVVNQNIAR